MSVVMSYGGGRQTVAMCVLVVRGILSKPDRIVIADTEREKPSTWEYLDAHVRPMLATIGLEVERVQGYKRVDLHDKHGGCLMPVWTVTGKQRTYCSSEWKRDAMDRYLREKGIRSGEKWIGFALDETSRIKTLERGHWTSRFPLVELMLTKSDCQKLILDFGMPLPKTSACYCCPFLTDQQWAEVRDEMPEAFEKACVLDEELREEDLVAGKTGVYLHHSRVPLRQAMFDEIKPSGEMRQCGLGNCFL